MLQKLRPKPPGRPPTLPHGVREKTRQQSEKKIEKTTNLMQQIVGKQLKPAALKSDSYTIRNFQCVPTVGGQFKTLEECEKTASNQRYDDSLMTILSKIDKHYLDLLRKFESLEKRASQSEGEKAQRLSQEAAAVGAKVAAIEAEYRSMLPVDVNEKKKLVAALKEQKGIDSYAELAEVYKQSLGKNMPATERIASLIKGKQAPDVAKSVEVNVPVKSKIGSARKTIESGAVPLVLNIYNNIAYPAPLTSKGDKHCINCPPLPKRGEKRKTDSYLLLPDGKHHRIFIGAKGALYMQSPESGKYRSLRIYGQEKK